MDIKSLKKKTEKELLLNDLSDKGISLMIFYDEPPGKGIKHEKVHESVFLIHPPLDYELLEKWLYLGNWHAIYPGNNEYKPFNTFKAANAEIEERMRESDLILIIDSFHDNIEWNVIERT